MNLLLKLMYDFDYIYKSFINLYAIVMTLIIFIKHL